MLGEFIGGPLMIVLLALLFRAFLRRRLVDEARAEANRGVVGRGWKAKAKMAMSVHARGSILTLADWRFSATGICLAEIS